MYTYNSRIRYSELDKNGQLSLEALLDYFQDCSTFQSEDLGIGLEYLRERHMVWVLSSWQIVVEEYPQLCDYVVIGTSPYELRGFLGYRNFFMMDEQGKKLAYANSIWTLLSTDTMAPTRATEQIIKAYAIEEKYPMEYCSRKIPIPEQGQCGEEIIVKHHHLDTNNHVNNGQYVRMAMDFLPEGSIVHQMRAEYKKSAVLGDILVPVVTKQGEQTIVVLQSKEAVPYCIVEFLCK